MCDGGGCRASVWMVRLRSEGKNVRGDDGHDVQQQWKMSKLVHRDKSVRWCVGLCDAELR